MLRFVITATVLACATGCAAPRPTSAPVAPSTVNPIHSLLVGYSVVYLHVASPDTTAQRVRAGDPLGTVEDMPIVQSARHQDLLETARHLYNENRFTEAAAAIRPALDDEPSNPFVLNEYARALFRVDSLHLASGPVYERLVALLTSQHDTSPNVLVVDTWFTDAYWKLALLYLDVGQYERAITQLLRVAISPGTEATKEQVYGHFAEAYFQLGSQDAADWFIRETLSINPRNEDVLQFRRP